MLVLVFSVTAFGICVFAWTQINILFIYPFSSLSIGMQTMDRVMIQQRRLKSPGRGQKGLFGFQQSEMEKSFQRRFRKSSVLLFCVQVLIKYEGTICILLYGTLFDLPACSLVPFSSCLLSRLRGLLCSINLAQQDFLPWARPCSTHSQCLEVMRCWNYSSFCSVAVVSITLLAKGT